MPRVEDKIRLLCAQLLAKRDEEELGPILADLREALHQHIQQLRKRFADYPFLVERRTQKLDPENRADGPDQKHIRGLG